MRMICANQVSNGGDMLDAQHRRNDLSGTCFYDAYDYFADSGDIKLSLFGRRVLRKKTRILSLYLA